MISKYLRDYVYSYNGFDIIVISISIILLCMLIYSILKPFYMKLIKKNANASGKTTRPNIVVVFDLDETLGSFAQLAVLQETIEHYENRKMNECEFNALIDQNSEFLRPGIIDILEYVVKQREAGRCDRIMLYTNNQGPQEWAKAICNYFSTKVGTNVFDQIIAAYKVNGRQVEPNRTSHDKSYADFIRCTGLPEDTQVCFLDDVDHPHMHHANVYYINLKPYSNEIPVRVSLDRYYQNYPNHQMECIMKAREIYSQTTLNGKNKSSAEQAVDRVIGKYTLQQIYDFFDMQHKFMNRKRRRGGGGGNEGCIV